MYTSLVPRLTVVNLVTPVPALTIGVCIRLTQACALFPGCSH